VVVGNGNARWVNDEARTGAGAVVLHAEFGIHEATLSHDLDGSADRFLERSSGHRPGWCRFGGRGRLDNGRRLNRGGGRFGHSHGGRRLNGRFGSLLIAATGDENQRKN
jgi:hypothetical protein